MSASWLFGFGTIVVIGALLVMRFRGLRALRAKLKDHPEKMDDDWDPFT